MLHAKSSAAVSFLECSRDFSDCAVGASSRREHHRPLFLPSGCLFLAIVLGDRQVSPANLRVRGIHCLSASVHVWRKTVLQRYHAAGQHRIEALKEESIQLLFGTSEVEVRELQAVSFACETSVSSSWALDVALSKAPVPNLVCSSRVPHHQGCARDAGHHRASPGAAFRPKSQQDLHRAFGPMSHEVPT
ncbi:uncharacterized protein BDZ83DRAFT_650257 [Colletotrichum acutatum]|uniref:Uncharacterized protein n=1 Tax=Glomerella acutata TaxID=27357 RepID=A0AAD8XIS0_GLOAC|nr:uncharacterized protein BDZ83DRAFT_650257 [Colletotrichum acutatum]KAK1726553.1 hypothetical protein BDZ83DRAFT_650257 [Colletotrichum acutatum]